MREKKISTAVCQSRCLAELLVKISCNSGNFFCLRLSWVKKNCILTTRVAEPELPQSRRRYTDRSAVTPAPDSKVLQTKFYKFWKIVLKTQSTQRRILICEFPLNFQSAKTQYCVAGLRSRSRQGAAFLPGAATRRVSSDSGSGFSSW